jgi:hypothetical protein
LKCPWKPQPHLSSEPPVSGLHCTALAVAFPFSLINVLPMVALAHKSISQFPGLWRQGPSTPAHNTSHWHIKLWQTYLIFLQDLHSVLDNSCTNSYPHAEWKSYLSPHPRQHLLFFFFWQ